MRELFVEMRKLATLPLFIDAPMEILAYFEIFTLATPGDLWSAGVARVNNCYFELVKMVDS